MKNYIISEEELLELLESRARLSCLEQDGVDNWTWYMEGRIEFIANALEISMEEAEDMDFIDVAREDLKYFQEI